MRLEQSMGMSQNQEMSQTMSLEQCLEMKQEMLVNMVTEAEGIRDEVLGKPEDLFKHVVLHVMKTIEDDQLRTGFEQIFDDNLIQSMFRQVAKLANPNREVIRAIIVDYLHSSHQGVFDLIIGDESGGQTQKFNIPAKALREALYEKDTINTEIKGLEEIIDTEKQSLAGTSSANIDRLTHEITELNAALHIAEGFQQYAQVLEKSIGYVITQKKGDALPEVKEFARELFIVRRFSYVLSERTQQRFATRFIQISPSSESKEYKTAFMNTIAEYVLVAMGIIDPGIFSLRSTTIEEDEYKALRTNFTELGMNLDEILKHYNLKPQGTIFWNRWNTLDIPPGRITDNLVRDFITETVRKNETEILQITNFDHFFQSVKDIVVMDGAKRRDERQETMISLREKLVELFQDKTFKEEIVKFIKEKWYPKLMLFYNQK
jgi:hypothetical protein